MMSALKRLGGVIVDSHALADPIHNVDAWLKNVVAGVLDKADVVCIERSELWSLLDNLPAAILISTDRECSRIVGNIAAGALLNAPLGSNLSQSAPPDEKPAFQVFSDGELMHPDDLPMQRAASTGRRVGRSECEIRFADGRRMFIAGHCIPITNDLGEVCGSIGAFVDVTERHVRHERDGLIAREMSHRVKNTVSLIQAMAHSTISNKLEAADYEAFEQRLIALAKAQDLIAETKTANVTLDELIRSSISLVAEAQMGRVQISGPEVWLSADLVQQLSMVFHELTTNACKYGALGNQGRLTVKWLNRDSAVSLEWLETCVAAPTTRSGFGSALIKSILRNQAKGELVRKFADGELLIRLSFLT